MAEQWVCLRAAVMAAAKEFERDDMSANAWASSRARRSGLRCDTRY